MSKSTEMLILSSNEDSDSEGDVMNTGASVRLRLSSVHEYFETLHLNKMGKRVKEESVHYVFKLLEIRTLQI